MPQTLSQKSQCVPTHSLWLSVSGLRPAARKMCPGNIRSLCYKSYNYIPMPPPFSWDAHLILKKNKTIQFFAPGSGGPAVWGIGMFAGKIGHQEYSTGKGSPEVNEPNTTGNLHLSRDKQRCWHSLHYDSMKILMWAARLKAVMPGACTIKNKTIWKFYGKKMVR